MNARLPPQPRRAAAKAPATRDPRRSARRRLLAEGDVRIKTRGGAGGAGGPPAASAKRPVRRARGLNPRPPLPGASSRYPESASTLLFRVGQMLRLKKGPARTDRTVLLASADTINYPFGPEFGHAEWPPLNLELPSWPASTKPS